MKKLLYLVILLAMITTGCASGNGETEQAGTSVNAEVEASVNNGSDSKTLEGEIKFYPTYDDEYKTASNEIYGFWFDIPVSWKAVDESEDGSAYTIITDNEKVEVKMYGTYINEPEEEFYTSLSGKDGSVSDFMYRDTWVGKQIVSGDETYYVRVDGDSYIILYIHSHGENEWMTENAGKINAVAMSARTTRESYGSSLDGNNSIALDDLKLGEMKLEMTYNELINTIGMEPDHEEQEEYEGLVAKTLFFPDETQVFIVDDSVYSINVTNPEYETPRGLKTGDSAEKLTELYGEPANKYEEGYMGFTYDGYELLTVLVKDGKVVEIQIDVAM